MKKSILLLVALSFILACSPRKNTYLARQYQGFITTYNVLFNGEEALATELEQREKAYKDNFSAPFIRLLTFEEQISDTEMQALGFGGEPKGSPPADFYNSTPISVSASANGGTGALAVAELKALKAIEKHAMPFNGQEKNKAVFDAYLLLAKARLFQNKPLEALDALNTAQKVFAKDKRLPWAKLYAAYALGKLKDDYRADESFRALKKEKLKPSQKRLLSILYAEMLLKAGKPNEAVEELEEAYAFNKNKKMRSRIAFLRGQILASLGKNEEARASFITAYKNARDYDFEIKSQIEMAKTFSGSPADYEETQKYLSSLIQKGTYASRKNEIYYALAMMALNQNQKEEALDFFRKSVREKISDPQVRGQAYYEIGKKYFAENDYLSAGVYFDSAYAVMNYAPVKERVKALTKNIKQISDNYYLIRKNDSLLKLVQMPEAERLAFYNQHISGIKAKEEKEALERKRQASNKDENRTDAFSLLNNAGNAPFMEFGQSKGFYFANASTVAKGATAFRQIWGDRALADNWRTAPRANTIQELKNSALGVPTAPNPRRLEPEFYLEQLPKDPEQLLALKKARDTASLGLGRMYEAFFGNIPLATKTLYDLVDAQPDPETELQALYLIFSMNYEKTPQAAARAKALILEKHPFTSYAEFVKNPQKKNLTASSSEVEAAYQQAFSLYAEEKFEASKKAIEAALQKYPHDLLVPKFLLLQAFNTGKTAGKEVMILQLEQLMLNYAKTPEGQKAAEMLKSIKSDLKVELRDAQGNPVPAVEKTQSPPVKKQ